MLFTNSPRLNSYEKMMRSVPDVGSIRDDKDMEPCTRCRNKEMPIIKCRNCRCSHIAGRTWKTHRTTKEWIESGLSQITYMPFAKRLRFVLQTFKGNRRYHHELHELAFKTAVSRYCLNESQYSKLACVYALSIHPELMRKVYVLADRVIPFQAKLDFKEKTILAFANQLMDPNAKLDLSWVSNDYMFSETEFICLCNAILIRDYGTAVIRERVQPKKQYIRIPC